MQARENDDDKRENWNPQEVTRAGKVTGTRPEQNSSYCKSALDLTLFMF